MKALSIVRLFRPFTVVPPVLIGCFFTFLLNQDLEYLFLATITLALLQIFGQIDNQLCDPVALDIINKKTNRPLINGSLSRIEAKAIRLMVFVFLVIDLVYLFLNHLIGASILLLMFLLTLFYNHEPLRLKKRLFISDISLALARGFFPLLFLLELADADYSYFIITTFLWTLGFQCSKDISDVKGDKKFGIRTIPNSFGLRITYLYMLFFALIVFLFLVSKSFIYSVVFLLAFILLLHKSSNNLWYIFYLNLVILYIINALEVVKWQP